MCDQVAKDSKVTACSCIKDIKEKIACLESCIADSSVNCQEHKKD